LLPEKHLVWNTSGKFNFWGFISIFIEKKTKLWKLLVKKKKGKAYHKPMRIQVLNLYRHLRIIFDPNVLTPG
jgi:predicted component of type VI protein secretion system